MDSTLEQYVVEVRDRLDYHRRIIKAAFAEEELVRVQTSFEKLASSVDLLVQELEEFEVVEVDDGSPQDAPEIWRPARITP